MKTATEHPHTPLADRKATVKPTSSRHPFALIGLAATLVTVLALSGCGGGAASEDEYVENHGFEIHAGVGGHAVNGTFSPSAAVQRVSLPAGQYIEFDANEPVVWELNVGGTTVSGPGVTIYYGDVAITLSELSASRILIDTAIRFPLSAPLSISLVARSTIYHDQVARIQVLLVP